uniref:Latexin n=1 Tax=Lepisosteus oculatus TaxID=7918 RepID=W5M822_LEPOC
MRWALCVALGLLPLVCGHPTSGTGQEELQDADPLRLQSGSTSGRAHEVPAETNPLPETTEVNPAMPVEELNPSHYQASRAAKVAEHYLNYHYGSPFRRFIIRQVKRATLEEIPTGAARYHIEFSLEEMVSNTTIGNCAAEIVFERTEEQKTPQVQCTCDDLLKINTSEAENSFFHQIKKSSALVSGQYIPDSYGFTAPEMTPLWHLGGVAASFVMLKESNESTLYNMAQILSLQQQESEGESLEFDYEVLLHEFISQEMIQWHMKVNWSPTEGVKVTQSNLQPKHHDHSPTTENPVINSSST